MPGSTSALSKVRHKRYRIGSQPLYRLASVLRRCDLTIAGPADRPADSAAVSVADVAGLRVFFHQWVAELRAERG
jgi:hypothetical protein